LDVSLLAVTILGLTISGRELAVIGLVVGAIIAAIGWYTLTRRSK
jgi:hypothetical protein